MTAETPQPPVGIDLGTTYSVTAYLDATGRLVTVRNGTVQQHPLRFRLPQSVTIEQKEKPADDLLPSKPKADA